jgi:endonuclease/exonuclease/phosphatase family metal-dependent hydrolase
MKRIISIFIFICVSVQFAFSQSQIRVLSYNIWDPADVPFWEKYTGGYPVEKVLGYITEDHADILLLQEVSLEAGDRTQSYERISASLNQKGYLYSAFYMPGGSNKMGRIGYVKGTPNSGYPLAIFSKYPIMETYAIQEAEGKKMPKGVLGVKLKIDDKMVYVFTTHLGIGEQTTNDEVSKVALPFVKAVTTYDDKVIFGGDWNSPPAADYPNTSKKIGDYTYSSQTTQYLLESGFEDSWMKIGNNKDGATCPGQDDYIKRVDQVYYKGDRIKVVGGFVKHNLWDFIKLQDHKGVVIDFEL